MKSDSMRLVEELLTPIVEKIVEQQLSEKGESVTNVKNPEQFLRIGQAAKEIGCSKYILEKAMENQELSYIQPESRRLIKRGDLYNYLESIRIGRKDECDF